MPEHPPKTPERDVAESGSFDLMRKKWRALLIGPPELDTSDPAVRQALRDLDTKTTAARSSMDPSPQRPHLWPDLPAGNPAFLTRSLHRLRTMAMAYRLGDSAHRADPALSPQILEALDWLLEKQFGPHSEARGNWWHWQIGIPLPLCDLLILLEEEISKSRVQKAMAAIAHHAPTQRITGSARTQTVMILRGAITGNATLIVNPLDNVIQEMATVESGNGFHSDGSFVAHQKFAYNGGYGLELLDNVSNLLLLLRGSPWELNENHLPGLFQRLFDSFEPFLHRGAMMDLVRGRNIAKHFKQGHPEGHKLIAAALKLSRIAPPPQADRIRRMIKEWILSDTFYDFFQHAPLPLIPPAREIVNDSTVKRRGDLILCRIYPAMDRVLHRRAGFAFGVSMSSTRMDNYEAILEENQRGWHTGNGMTSLHNADLSQFDDQYWPTVDCHRLPGVTAWQHSKIPHQTPGGSAWAGGVTLQEQFGAAGMILQPKGQSLRAKKSWFLFEDEIVALGSDIESHDGQIVETTMENRKLDSEGTETLTIDGCVQPKEEADSKVLRQVHWMHLAGTTPGAEIGYYFPDPADLHCLRQTRKGSWAEIDRNDGAPEEILSRNYLTLWFDHGKNPEAGGYAYVLLPDRSAAQVENYSRNPETRILAKSGLVHAVMKRNLGLVGANFWTNKPAAVHMDGTGSLSCVGPAAVIVRETVETIAIAVADPTWQSASISLEIPRQATSLQSSDPRIHVTQRSPTIQLTVDTRKAKGRGFSMLLKK